MTTISDSLNSSYEIAKCFDESLNGIIFERNDKNTISSSFYSLSLEHHRGVIVLAEQQLYGSASALLRSLFEAYVKGMWFYHCATEIDFENLGKDKFKKQFHSMINDLEEKGKAKGISKQKIENWSGLNSLTHSGLLQINKRSDEHSITSNYDSGFILDTLLFANNYALLNAGELAKISNNKVSQQCVLKVAEKLNFKIA